MFILALASLLFGYAVTYYAINAMSHYDSATKTTLAIPFGVTLGLPGAGTAMVFARWGASSSGGQATGTASSPSAPAPPDVNTVIQV